MKKHLFSPIKLGRYSLPNRIVLAPMTRCRAGEGNVPSTLAPLYYSQRSTAGLLITEATQVSPRGQGYPHTPGIHTPEQRDGWRPVVEAVHNAGSRIFLQLWHVGRISHPLFQPNGDLPVAPSAIAPKGECQTLEGMKPFVTPRALETAELPGIVEEFKKGAKFALEAGFDGVEIHAANGYLLDQFLKDGTNHRTDAYGGSIENRSRLLLEVAQAVIDVWGSDRVGVRLSPSGNFNDMSDSDPVKHFSTIIESLDALEILYVHLREGSEAEIRHGATKIPTSTFRPFFQGAIITNDGFDRAKGDAVISSGDADLVAFGMPFIANPDLPRRLQIGAELAETDAATIYGGNEKGYTDYPTLTIS